MIKAKGNLTGKLNNAVVREYPELENLEVTPSMAEQNFKSNKYGYDEVKVKAIETNELAVTPSAEEQVQEGLFNKVTVAGDSDLKAENIKEGVELFGVVGTAKVQGEPVYITNAAYLFNNGARLDYLNGLLAMCKDVTNTSRMFYNAKTITRVDLSSLDTSKVTTMASMFCNASDIEEINVSNFNTGNVTDMSYMFSDCYALKKIDLSSFDTSKVTTMGSMFSNCKKISEIKVQNFDTSKVTNVGYMFKCYNAPITELDLSSFDLSSVNFSSDFISNLAFLEVLNSFRNLGKGYTQKSANYGNYTLDLSTERYLNHDSLIDVITNGLYDLNLTYDVANGGTLYTQKFILGSKLLPKLTAEEIAIATAKGWTVS